MTNYWCSTVFRENSSSTEKYRDIIIIVFYTKFQNDLTIEMDVEFELWVHNELPMDILNYKSPFVLNDKEFFPRYPCFTELCVSV